MFKETSVSAWNPSNKGDVEVLEKVQKRALRMVNNFGHLTYEERLQQAKLQSLEQRRKRGDLIDTYKIMNGHYALDPNNFFKFVQDRHKTNTRSHENNALVPEKTRLNIRKHFYPNRVIEDWNNLPKPVKEATSVNNFKNLYDKFSNS